MLEHAEGRGDGHNECRDHGKSHQDHDECSRTVSIIVDNKDIHLHSGRYELDVLKTLAKVQACDDLDQLVGTKLVPIPHDKTIEIRGCEIFVSHPKSGGSS